MIADLGIDMLAAGIGNIHGQYPANWQGLDFETLAKIKEQCGNMPLVLHGGTGIPEDMIKKAISLGVCKINVNTECQLAFAAATREYIESGKDREKKALTRGNYWLRVRKQSKKPFVKNGNVRLHRKSILMIEKGRCIPSFFVYVGGKK